MTGAELSAAWQAGNRRLLARFLTRIENDMPDYSQLMGELPMAEVPVIGVTGPPGAGKSTLINALVSYLLQQNKKVAVVAVDPSSPFNQGAIMGDRLRMSENFLHPNLFIRSMASRGSLGGLAPKIFEVSDALRAAGFDYVLIETVGVGQSEVEIAALADTTLLVLVPEAGDDIQTMKSGVMEIADIFVLNKSEREGADVMYRNLSALAHQYAQPHWEAPVIRTIASRQQGIEELVQAVHRHQALSVRTEKKIHLLAQKALLLIRALRTRDIRVQDLESQLHQALEKPGFNLYRFVNQYQL